MVPNRLTRLPSIRLAARPTRHLYGRTAHSPPHQRSLPGPRSSVQDPGAGGARSGACAWAPAAREAVVPHPRPINGRQPTWYGASSCVVSEGGGAIRCGRWAQVNTSSIELWSLRAQSRGSRWYLMT